MLKKQRANPHLVAPRAGRFRGTAKPPQQSVSNSVAVARSQFPGHVVGSKPAPRAGRRGGGHLSASSGASSSSGTASANAQPASGSSAADAEGAGECLEEEEGDGGGRGASSKIRKEEASYIGQVCSRSL